MEALNSTIKLSVALVTRNRPESLRRCLKSWSSQTQAPFEIVVSDDSDDEWADKTKEIAQEFSAIYMRGPRRGLYANRNHAALSCRGTHILSADDDHVHPPTFTATIYSLIHEDQRRVWIFGERHPDLPDAAVYCPPELHVSGFGQSPKDPANCSSIADGASVYPRVIFDSGLRYDETYPFGGLWYLWGKVLTKHGFRISFSDKTCVYHYGLHANRFDNLEQLKRDMECTTYILFANAFWLNRSPVNIFWAFAYLLRRMCFKDSILWYQVRTRISPASAMRALNNALSYPGRAKLSEVSTTFHE